MSPVEVVDWSPQWAVQYDDVAAVLREALTDVASARVEHVGSTSVRRNLYVCTAGTANVRNHLAVRTVLRSRDD
ncbi:MAG TPA: GrpB family protein, partial [Nocardioides sp.]